MDGVIVAVMWFAGQAAGLGTLDGLLLVTAAQLSYFFVLEAYWGQTVGKAFFGLRVMTVDGSPAPANAVAARTILRLVEEPFIALLALVLSGERRRRLGDLLGGTMVGRVSECPVPTPPTAWHLIYPIAWMGLAAGAGVVLFDEQSEYLATMDAICAERVAVQERMAQPIDARVVLGMSVRETDLMAGLVPPPEERAFHSQVVSSKRRFEELLAGSLQAARRRDDVRLASLDTAARDEVAAHNAMFADAGLEYCSR